MTNDIVKLSETSNGSDLMCAFLQLVHLAGMLEVDDSEIELEEVTAQAAQINDSISRGGIWYSPSQSEIAILCDVMTANPGTECSRRIRRICDEVHHQRRLRT